MLGSLISGGLSLIGGAFGDKKDRQIGDQNAALQRDFAKQGIQWKVADAKKAGVHPLFALGANTAQASPSYVNGNSMSDAISSAGQDIGRALDARRSSAGRLANQLLESQIDGQKIDNALKREELASRATRSMSAQTAPPFPRPDGISDVEIPMYATLVDEKGGKRPIIHPDYGQIMENYPVELLRGAYSEGKRNWNRHWRSQWNWAKDRLGRIADRYGSDYYQ